MFALFEIRSFRCRVGCALAAAALTLGTTGAQTSAASAGPASVAFAQVPRAGVQDLGLAPRTARIHIALALNYRNAGELEAFIRATSQPGSPEFGHFLSPQAFDAAFGAAPADYARAAAALTGAGFTVIPSANASVVEATAPVAVVERFFGTLLHAVRQDGVAGLRYANAAPAYLPAALAGITYDVAGLNDLVVAKTLGIRAPRRVDLALGPPLQGPDTGLGPFALASAYDLPVQHARPGGGGKTYDGTGRAAGIAIDSDVLDSDVAAFLAYFNIKRSGPPLVRVPVDGGSAGITGDGGETALDVETIAGLAPGAGLYVYLMPDLSTLSIVDTYAKVVAEDKVDVLNSSFGGCEISGDHFATLTDHVAKQGAAEGISFAASTGDTGAQDCVNVTPNYLGVSAPASDPDFTAVGGTTLIINPAGAYKREFAWTGSGGGVSTIFALPAYQNGVKNVLGKTRNLPDIAFDADPGSGAAFYYQGAFAGPMGGTSLASPIFCAFVTEYDETVGKRLGNADETLYAVFKKDGYGTRFRDITLGNNSFYAPGYSALTGYDRVTGIGSVIGTPHAP